MKRAIILTGVVLLAAGGMARAAEMQRVLVTPFNVLNVPENQQWIGRGVQENIVADLGRSGEYSPVAFQGQVIVEDNATAARLGRNAQSPLSIRGTAQMVGTSIRITAQLIDSKSGDTVRTASVTGEVNNLLKLEDELSAQLRGETSATVPGTAPAIPNTGPAPAQQPQIIVINQPPQQQYYQQPAYSYPAYSYPAYPYGSYPIFYPNYGSYYFTQVSGNCVPAPCNFPSNVPCGPVLPGNVPHLTQVNSGFNPTALPIPTNNVLPIPNNNVLPVPNNNVLPIARSNVSPVPVSRVQALPARSVQPAANSRATVPVSSRAVTPVVRSKAGAVRR